MQKKSLFKMMAALCFSAVLPFGFASCSDSDDDTGSRLGGGTFTDGKLVYILISGSSNELEVGNMREAQTEVVIPPTITYDDVTYSVTAIGNYAFYRTGLTSATIPNSVRSIGGYAFSQCTGLTDVSLPNSVSIIGPEAFSGCAGLTGGLALPASLTTIGSSAFQGCAGLTGGLVLPDMLAAIGDDAFNSCSGLTSVTIPVPQKTEDETAYIEMKFGNNVFNNCSGITDIYVLCAEPKAYLCQAGTFAGLPEACRLHVPAGCGEAYAAVKAWSRFGSNIVEDAE